MIGEAEILVDGAHSALDVRKITLRGSHAEIGRWLGSYARSNLGVVKRPWTDPSATREQRAWLARYWPAHYARAQGAASAFEASFEDDTLDFSFLYYDVGVPGCSVVFYPPATTRVAAPLVARNFDYPYRGIPRPGEAQPGQAHAARAFLIEARPTDGIASLYMCAFDLLGACMDGVNEHGLAVALLADNETVSRGLATPIGRNAVGLNEIQTPLFLLETCANAQEARAALRAAPHYHAGTPNHFLVADRSGDAFVWEMSSSGDEMHIIDANGAALCVTNHLLHTSGPADTPAIVESRARLDALRNALTDVSAEDAESARQRNLLVEARTPAGEGQYAWAEGPARTLWCAVYDLTHAAVSIDFFSGDGAGGPSRTTTRRFSLTKPTPV